MWKEAVGTTSSLPTDSWDDSSVCGEEDQEAGPARLPPPPHHPPRRLKGTGPGGACVTSRLTQQLHTGAPGRGVRAGAGSEVHGTGR